MKKSRLRQTSMEVTVGTFMLMILLALGFFTIILSHENIFTKSYELEVVFSDVTGLIRGDKVAIHGVDIGRVKALTVKDDGVHLFLSLKQDVRLRRDYAISVNPSSVLGGKYISISPGSPDQPLVPENELIIGQTPVDFIVEATEAIQSVRESLEEGGVLENLKVTMSNMTEVTEGLKNGEGTIGKLLKDEQVYNELKDVATNLKELTAKINQGEGSLGKLVNDAKVYDDLEAITADLREVSDRLANGKGTLGKLLSEDDKLYNDLADAAASIKDISGSISNGKGTLGKLTKDDEMYDQLNKLLVEVRAAIDDIRETSPVTSFSSIFFGAF